MRRSAETKARISTCSSISKRFSSFRSDSTWPPDRRAPHDCFHTERGAGEELDDTIVDIARKREARACCGAFLDRRNQRVMVEDRARGPAELDAKLEVIDGEGGDIPEDQPAPPRARAHVGDNALDCTNVSKLGTIEQLFGSNEPIPPMLARAQRFIAIEIEQDHWNLLAQQRPFKFDGAGRPDE